MCIDCLKSVGICSFCTHSEFHVSDPEQSYKGCSVNTIFCKYYMQEIEYEINVCPFHKRTDEPKI